MDTLTAANKTDISIDGSTDLKVSVDEFHYSAHLIVSSNVDKVTLGHNSMSENRVVWSFHDGIISNRTIQLRIKRTPMAYCKCFTLKTDCEIPPRSELSMPVNIVFGDLRAEKDDGHWTTTLAEPIPELRVARTLVPQEPGKSAIRICNITEKMRHLSKSSAPSKWFRCREWKLHCQSRQNTATSSTRSSIMLIL